MPEKSKTKRFFQHIAELCDSDRAVAACLRRSLSFPPGEWPRAFPYVEPFVIKEEQNGFRRKMFYLMAGVWAAARERTGETPFGAALRRYMIKTDSDSIEKRFVTLLDSDEEQLPNRLRQICAFLKDSPVDFPSLLDGLLFWNAPGKKTQWRWAKDFYAASEKEKDE